RLLPGSAPPPGVLLGARRPRGRLPEVGARSARGAGAADVRGAARRRGRARRGRVAGVARALGRRRVPGKVEAQRLRQEYRHLSARERRVGTVVSGAAAPPVSGGSESAYN